MDYALTYKAPGTAETRPYPCLIKGRQFIIYDTPGFDDTFTGDADILANVAESLSASYKNQLKLTGVVYLHRIKDEKMTNAIMRNLSMFKNLCGEGSLKNTVLATTFWDELPSLDKGESREQQLAQRREYWGYMTSKGAKMRRFMNTRESALEIVLELAEKPRITLQIQEEMVNQGLGINQTRAGEALNAELAEMAKKHEEALKQLRLEMEIAIRDRDVELQETLAEMQKEKEEQLNRLINEQEAMRADRREELRRMTQQHNDQLLRLEADRKEREVQVAALEARLTSERADSERRIQEAMAKSDDAIRKVTKEMAMVRSQDRANYQLNLDEMKRQREQSEREYERWKVEVANENKRIAQLKAAQQEAVSSAEREWLDQRIYQLERQKKSRSDKVFSVLGNVLTLGLPVLLGGGVGAASFFNT